PPLFSLHLCVLPLSPPLSTLFPYTTLFRSVPKSDRLPIPEVHGPTVCCQALRLRVHKRLGCSQIRFPGGFPVSWQAWRIMQIGVYGSGYLGTVVSACLADFGTPVTCCHPDSSRMVEMAQG